MQTEDTIPDADALQENETLSSAESNSPYFTKDVIFPALLVFVLIIAIFMIPSAH